MGSRYTVLKPMYWMYGSSAMLLSSDPVSRQPSAEGSIASTPSCA